jgi:hypothetical protein
MSVASNVTGYFSKLTASLVNAWLAKTRDSRRSQSIATRSVVESINFRPRGDIRAGHDVEQPQDGRCAAKKLWPSRRLPRSAGNTML